MVKSKRRYYLLVPTSIVRGKQCKLDAKTFTVYCYLIHQAFLMSEKNETMEIDHADLKLKTHILDNRTLKRCFNKLHDCGLIKEKIEKLPNKQFLYVTLFANDKGDFFTRMPVDIFARLKEIGHVGFRLAFYYESFINRKLINRQFAFPSFRTIRNDLEISFDTLLKYNKILTDIGLLSVVKYELDKSSDENDEKFTKWNNKYYVLLHKL